MPCGWILVQFKDIYMCSFEIQPFITTFLFYNIVVQSHNVMQLVSLLVTLWTLQLWKTNSLHWLNILNISYSNLIIRSLKHNGGKIVKRRLPIMWKTKCMTFDEIVVPKVERRKWGMLAPILDIFTVIPSL